jgi:hypothetical protein
MSNSSSSSSSASISTAGLLGVLFVGLKLTGFIHWPWLWVLAPFWIPIAIILAIFGMVGIGFVIAYFLDNKK